MSFVSNFRKYRARKFKIIFIRKYPQIFYLSKDNSEILNNLTKRESYF